ncbi:hypothetical protein CNYM01_13915 [Colletotrichum nymphaeae SA-01]|uniref:C2H2-type domain-containing protein n=1 Tax=Colletotrichum nymphaeae SA-01 TaxID=1460502 RepID=A0A135UTK1_9PEZI|nr:hypothetical protein CNYM01_13915 [Colletotrichum nymphaeae SA-01]
MGHKTIASSRMTRLDATQVHDGVASSRPSAAASARVDEASRDLAYQFLHMNRSSRRASIVNHNTEVSEMPSPCPVSFERPLSLTFDTPLQLGDRRHSSFESENMPSLAYRVKPPQQLQPHNPRKHQRGSPSVDSLEERPGSTEERHCKRISGDSGYGSDTRRRSRDRSGDSSEYQDMRTRDVKIYQRPGSNILIRRCPSPQSDSDGTLGVPQRRKRYLRRYSAVVITHAPSDPTPTPKEVGLATQKTKINESPSKQSERVAISRESLDVEKERLDSDLSVSVKGLRRMKGTTALRDPVGSPQPPTSNTRVMRAPRAIGAPSITSTTVQPVPEDNVPQSQPSLIGPPSIRRNSTFGDDLARRARNRLSLFEDADGHPVSLPDPRTTRPNLHLETSLEPPAKFERSIQPVSLRMPRPVSGPPNLPLNWHANLTPRPSFLAVEEQSDSANDSGDESSIESSVFSVPDSPVEPFQLDREDPLASHMGVVVGNIFQRYQEWNVRERGGQSRRASGQRVNTNTPDSGRSSRKRSHSDDLPDQDASDGGDSNVIPGFKKPKVPANTSKLMFACPFWKNDPDNHRQCYKKVLSQIKYVKSHLYRFHAAPITCPCCGAAFQDEETRDQHARARRCEVVSEGYIPSHEGLSQGRMRQVSKRANPSHSPEEQWFTIWDIVFPSKPRPSSPYIDGVLSEDLCSLREFYTSVGTDMMLDYLASRDPDFANDERRAAMYDRVAFNQLQERIYEAWMARRGLRQTHDPNISTTPPRTESDEASRASPANGVSSSKREDDPAQQQSAQTQMLLQQQQSSQEEATTMMQPTPVPPDVAVQFTGQDFGEADFSRDDMYYDTHTQALFADLNGLLPAAGRSEFDQGGFGPPYVR